VTDNLSKSELNRMRREAAATQRVDKVVIETLAELDDEHRLYIFRPEAQCKVCNSQAFGTVNLMLAHAMTYADILRALVPVNDALPEDQRIVYASIRTHAKRHFPIQGAAQAVYRRMVEKRAEEYGLDFVRGVGGALTPLAYVDVVMRKGFETLVKNETTVDVETGMRAAVRLREMTKDNEESGDIASLMLQMNKVVEAVKSTVPEEMWPVILAKIEGDDNIIDAETVEEDPNIVDIVAGYDPGDPDFVDDDPEGENDSEHY